MNQHSVLPYATPHLGMGKGDFNAFQNTNLPGRMFYIVFFFLLLIDDDDYAFCEFSRF